MSPSPREGDASSPVDDASRAALDPWLDRLAPSRHPWAGREGAALWRAQGRLRRTDPLWGLPPAAVVIGLGLGWAFHVYKRGRNGLPRWSPIDCGPIDACLSRTEQQPEEVVHRHVNAFTGRREGWIEPIARAVTLVSEAQSRDCFAERDRCLGRQDAAHAELSLAIDEQQATLRHALLSTCGVTFAVAAVVLGLTVGSIALFRWRRRVPRGGLVEPPGQDAGLRGAAPAPPSAEAIARGTLQIRSGQNEDEFVRALQAMAPEMRAVVLLQERAVLAGELLAEAERRDQPHLLRHVLAALAEAHSGAGPAEKAEITRLLQAHDLCDVSARAWQRGQGRLAALAVAGGWKTVKAYLEAFPPKDAAARREDARELIRCGVEQTDVMRELFADPAEASDFLEGLGGAFQTVSLQAAALLDDDRARAYADGHSIPFAFLRPDQAVHRTLSRELLDFVVTHFDDVNTLLKNAPMPRDAASQKWYKLRLAAAWAVRPARKQMATESNNDCAVCLETFGGDVATAVLTFCQHQPAVCEGCLRKIALEPKPCCPTCRQAATPEDLMNLGRDGNAARAYAQSVLKRADISLQ